MNLFYYLYKFTIIGHKVNEHEHKFKTQKCFKCQGPRKVTHFLLRDTKLKFT